MVSKVSDVKSLVARGRTTPASVFAELKRMAADEDWHVREVAATALVEIAKKQGDAVIAEMKRWRRDRDENVRRASSEGLRGLARLDFRSVLPVLEQLRTDASLYVKKSVANLLRDGSQKDPALILSLAARWAREGDPNTAWIVKNGLKKLAKSDSGEVAAILRTIEERKETLKARTVTRTRRASTR